MLYCILFLYIVLYRTFLYPFVYLYTTYLCSLEVRKMEIKSEDEKVRVFKTLKRISKKKDSGKVAQIERVEKCLEDLIESCAETFEVTANTLTKEMMGTRQTAYKPALAIIHQEVK